LVFSPHPDDEVITGGIGLRLLREAGWRVVNVAVTLGSDRARRAERDAEGAACCDYIGFERVLAAPSGLEGVNLDGRQRDVRRWAAGVQRIADILVQHAPRAVCFPHAGDWNQTHMGTHQLLVDALAALGPGLRVLTLETEFWGAMSAPNLMLELGADDVASLVAALACHVGEVRRNPYHLSLPAWMIDNVRRGSELVLGQGAAAPAFTFATLYRLRRWENGAFAPLLARGCALSVHDDVDALIR
ncbi:MAG TPA: PIG-L family deacetylase, partial [Polyangiaceae bacterium]|nr:PIG-L family deacetylase [Polyangiaceae bacterium]